MPLSHTGQENVMELKYPPQRRKSRSVKIGDVLIGGGFPIAIQTMTTADTRDVEATVAQTGWKMGGAYNLENALAAIAAARSAGVPLEKAVNAMSRFDGVKRRLERTATVSEVAIYDDFAHHPTAIRRTIAGMKRRYPGQRIVIALEPRSNTMKLGVHNSVIAEALDGADLVAIYRPDDFPDEFDASLAPLGNRLNLYSDYDELVTGLSEQLLAGDQLVFMSNGGFGAVRQKLTMALQQKRQT